MRYFNLKLTLFGALFVLLCIKGVDVISSHGVLHMPGNSSAVAGVEDPAKAAPKPLPPAPAPYDELKSLSPRPDIVERAMPTKTTTVKAHKNIAHSAANLKKNNGVPQAKRNAGAGGKG
ncbi:MAG: hypothetical protein HQK81_05635 [Desulfovibrionaceae bacterium]|nr:hypothetical protein [Desulfovibrionaceae bacterium]MBF0513530.1 hypothetical protein [Desulfovibrionaceae bacterium]